MIIKDEKIQINQNKHISISEFIIPEHGIIGISGKSGTGKSTLLNHIHHGQLSHYFGNDISYMSQENLFFEYMNIKENISFQLSLVNKKLDINASAISDFNIKALLSKKVNQLSIGEKQRVNFVIQILRSSKVILLDEPTASLNEHYITIMKEYLYRQKEESLIIVTSHNPEIFEICDSIYKIENNELNMVKNNCENTFQKNNICIRFQHLKFSLNKFGNQLIRGIPIYLVISIICTGLSLMHSVKYQMLDYQKDMLDAINKNTITVMKTDNPYGKSYYDDCLPITDEEWKALNDIDGINCYPLYYIVNEDCYTNENMTIYIYDNNKEITTSNNSVAIVPYFNSRLLENNLVYGEMKENGIYINSRIIEYGDNEEKIYSDNLSVSVDVMIPTHYSITEATYDSFEEFDTTAYLFEAAYLYGDIVNFNSEIDGVVDNMYYGTCTGAMAEIYVPYEMYTELVSSHLTNQKKEFENEMMEPYTYGAVCVEMNDFNDVDTINKQILAISELFTTQYSYTNQAKHLKVYQNFKNEIDLFEYAGIIFSLLFSYGYWQMKKKYDEDIHHKLKLFKLSKKQYLKYYFIDSLLDTFMILSLTLIMSFISFQIILRLGENLVYDYNATIAALVSSLIISLVMKIVIERKLLYDRDK